MSEEAIICYCFPFLFLQSGRLLLKDDFVPGGANYSRTSVARTWLVYHGYFELVLESLGRSHLAAYLG